MFRERTKSELIYDTLPVGIELVRAEDNNITSGFYIKRNCQRCHKFTRNYKGHFKISKRGRPRCYFNLASLSADT